MKFSHYQPTATGYRVFFIKSILWGLFKYEKSYWVNKKLTGVEGAHSLSENIFILDETRKYVK